MKLKFLAGAVAALCIAQAHATTITVSAQGLAAANAAEASFLASLTGPSITENFDSMTADNSVSYPVIVTSFGVAGQITPAGSPNVRNNPVDGLKILDAETTPYSGRFAISGSNWLDSNDSQEMGLGFLEGFNSVGFYITDANDVNGRMSLTLIDGTEEEVNFDDIFKSSESNGSVFYINLYSDVGIGALYFASNAPDDGFGLDDITVGTQVPEPGSLALLGMGLVGLGFTRRHVKAA
jgi:hypothetical protein